MTYARTPPRGASPGSAETAAARSGVRGRLRRLGASAVVTAVLLFGTIAAAGASGPAGPATAATLAPAWSSHFGVGKYGSSPVIAGDFVYVGDEDGALTKLPLATGTASDPGTFTPTWTTTEECFNQILSDPVVANKKVFVGTIAGYVCAFDDATGELLWRQAMPNGGWVNGLTLVGDTLYASAWYGAVVAFDAFSETGTPRWTAQVEGADKDHPVFAAPVVLKGTVYLGDNDGRILAITPPPPGDTTADVTELRRFVGARVDDALATDGTNLFLTINYELRPNSGLVRVLSLTPTGKTRWSDPLEFDRRYNGLVPTPTVVGGKVYVPTHSSVVVLDSETGHRDAIADTGDQLPTSPTVVNGVIYVGGLQIGGHPFGALQAFEATTRKLLYYSRTSTVAKTTPAVAANGTVVLGGGNGDQGAGVLWAYAPADFPQNR